MNITALHLSLKEMDELLLAAEINERVKALGFGTDMADAIILAAFCHAGQSRANRGRLPRDTYVTHPLRNTLRLMRYGVTSRSILVGEVLHDTVEDSAEVIHFLWGDDDFHAHTPEVYRDSALRYLEQHFGQGVVQVVYGMSNPLADKDVVRTKDEKRADYLTHMAVAAMDPEVAVGKASDLVDNAVGLYHNTGMSKDAIEHLSKKYIPALKFMINRIMDDDVVALMTPAGAARCKVQLEEGLKRLQGE